MVIKKYDFEPRIEVRTFRNGKRVSVEEYEADSFFHNYPSKEEIKQVRLKSLQRNDLNKNTIYVIEVSEKGIKTFEEGL